MDRTADNLKKYFIATQRPYAEGAVEVFEQPVFAENAKSAVLYITALGVYEAELNGEKVGDMLFAPGFTYYPRELQYQRYDVTGKVGAGSVLRVYLGQGWYCGRFGYENKVQIYGDRPAASWMLMVEGQDGQTTLFTSADKNVAAVKSPYEYAGLYDGEIYRAGGSDMPAYPPVPYTGRLPERLDETLVCVRVREKMPVKSVTVRISGADSQSGKPEQSCSTKIQGGAAGISGKTAPGSLEMAADDVTILDFGQNFAGFLEIDPEKMEGGTLRLRHGEILNRDGSLYTENLRKAKAELIYTKGGEHRKYRPRFTYMGFRYAELSGVPWRDGLVTACAVYSDMKRTGEFHCENALVQRLYENQVWGQKSNYVEIPTDCPQRDERMGYTGDGHVFAQTGAYNYDVRNFWRKFLRDIRFSQLDNREGYVAPKIPASGPEGVGFMSMLGWGSAVTIVPELLYRQYGDFSFLSEQYESMKAHVECEIRRMGKPAMPGFPAVPALWIGPSLGDWLAPGLDTKYMAAHNNPVSNAFILNDLRILSETAAALGKAEDDAHPHSRSGTAEGESYPHTQPGTAKGESYLHTQSGTAEGESYLCTQSGTAESESYLRTQLGTAEGESCPRGQSGTAKDESHPHNQSEWAEDAARYRAQLEKSRAAYLASFVRKDGTMADDYQGAYVMALAFAIPEGPLWNRVFEKLTGKLRQEGLKTGFFATQHLLPLLAEHGEARLAYDLLLNEDCPGWLYQVKNGATTVWERWDALRPDGTVNEEKMSDGENMVSFNHYAFGSVGEFFYRDILGIRPAEPGFAKIQIAPVPDERLGRVSGSYESEVGRIEVAWELRDGEFSLKVSVPASAQVLLPDGTKQNIKAGTRAFSIRV